MWGERDQPVDKVLGVQYEGQSLDPQFWVACSSRRQSHGLPGQAGLLDEQ